MIELPVDFLRLEEIGNVHIQAFCQETSQYAQRVSKLMLHKNVLFYVVNRNVLIQVFIFA